jgi:hypothetical protein
MFNEILRTNFRLRLQARFIPTDPDRRKNEAAYWAMRDQLLNDHRDQWVAFADGKVVASSKSPSEVLLAGRKTAIPLCAAHTGYDRRAASRGREVDCT